MLDAAGMGVVGHTAWFLPFASPVERVRRAAVAEVAASLPAFAEVGARVVNVHIVKGLSSFGHATTIRLNGASFAVLAELVKRWTPERLHQRPLNETLHEVRRRTRELFGILFAG